MTASYSGSTNGFWLPSKATANYVIPSTCNQQSIIQEIQSQQNMLDAQLSSDAQYMSSMVQGAMGQMVNMGEPFRMPQPFSRTLPQRLHGLLPSHRQHAGWDDYLCMLASAYVFRLHLHAGLVNAYHPGHHDNV